MVPDALTKSLPAPGLQRHRSVMMGHTPFYEYSLRAPCPPYIWRLNSPYRLLNCHSIPFERESEGAHAYAVSRSPQTHTVVPELALLENTSLYEQVMQNLVYIHRAVAALLQLGCMLSIRPQALKLSLRPHAELIRA